MIISCVIIYDKLTWIWTSLAFYNSDSPPLYLKFCSNLREYYLLNSRCKHVFVTPCASGIAFVRRCPFAPSIGWTLRLFLVTNNLILTRSPFQYVWLKSIQPISHRCHQKLFHASGTLLRLFWMSTHSFPMTKCFIMRPAWTWRGG